jgi:hypothetical protein
MEVVVARRHPHLDPAHHVRRLPTGATAKNEDPTFAAIPSASGSTARAATVTTCEVETRNLKGPRVYDSTGLPFHEDNATVVKERIYLDKADANLLHDDITVTDHALTRPFSSNKKYSRNPDPQPVWLEAQCADGNHHVLIGKENYYVSEDGYLMPVKKDQAPPDLKFFKKK